MRCNEYQRALSSRATTENKKPPNLDPASAGAFFFFDLGQTVLDNPRRHCWQKKYLRLKLSAMPPRGSHIDRTKGLLKIDPRPRLADVKKRFAERDQRQATDTRSAAEKWLGDPPPDRSALASRLKFPREAVDETSENLGTISAFIGAEAFGKPN